MVSKKSRPKKRKLPSSNESAVLRVLMANLAQVDGLIFWRQNTGAVSIGKRFVRFGLKGQGDITGIIRGGIRLEIECKAPKGVLSDNQKTFRNSILSMGGIYLVCTGVSDIDRVVGEVARCAALLST